MKAEISLAIELLARAASEAAECDYVALLPYIRAAWEHKVPKVPE